MHELSIFADNLLVSINFSVVFVFKLNISPACAIPSGVFLDFAPLPPLRYIPCSSGDNDSFRAPMVVVVVPEECQSKPKTQENAWNQYGFDILLMNSFKLYSSMMTEVNAPDSSTILVNNHLGGCPPCRGKLTAPRLCMIIFYFSLFKKFRWEHLKTITKTKL